MSKKEKINPKDAHHKLPEEYANSKKNVCDHIRKASRNKISQDDEISEEVFKGFTDLETIEKLVFEGVLNNDQDLIVIRLYVVKSELNSFKDKVKGFFSNFYTEIGTNHLAVQIADKMIHWYDCGMVLVQEYEGSKATAVFYPQNKDQESVPVIDNTPENRLKICKVIQKYNCTLKYDLKKTNCQSFAKDVFNALDLLADFTKMEGPVGYYLNYIISDKGRNTKEHAFLVDKKGNLVKDQSGNELTWKTHEALDDWTKENIEAYETYSPVIKAFHRAFQMREKAALKKNPNAEVYKSVNCHFGMPTLFMKSRNEKEEVDIYDIETSVSTSFKFSGLSGTSGGSGLSSNKN